MLALRKAGPAPGLALQDVPEPPPCAAGEALVQVHATGICGSDLHIADWHATTFAWLADKLPVTMGHEFAGTVVAVGEDVRNVQIGDRVTVQPTLYCGRCAACLAGDAERCSAMGFLGVTREGAFCRQVKVPAASCYVLAPHVDLALAALAEPLAVAHNALHAGQVPPGATVLVLGPGTIGQGIAVQAMLAGATVVVAGLNDAERLRQCQALGLEHVVDLAHETLADALVRCIGGTLVDRVFEATGHPQSVADALQVLAVGGVLTCSGIHFQNASLDVSHVVRKRLQIRGAYGSAPRDWDAVMRLLDQHGPQLAPMVTHRLPLARIEEGFALARSKAASKVLVFPEMS